VTLFMTVSRKLPENELSTVLRPEEKTPLLLEK
jgi:hypothetical protein